ncbi:MAG: hypothetical protein C4346_18440, partial [Chloroflexota bacterium]
MGVVDASGVPIETLLVRAGVAVMVGADVGVTVGEGGGVGRGAGVKLGTGVEVGGSWLVVGTLDGVAVAVAVRVGEEVGRAVADGVAIALGRSGVGEATGVAGDSSATTTWPVALGGTRD